MLEVYQLLGLLMNNIIYQKIIRFLAETILNINIRPTLYFVYNSDQELSSIANTNTEAINESTQIQVLAYFTSDVSVRPKVDQIGPICDKSGTFAEPKCTEIGLK